MITVRPALQPAEQARAVAVERPSHEHAGPGLGEHPAAAGASMASKAGMTILTIACLIIGIAFAEWLDR